MSPKPKKKDIETAKKKYFNLPTGFTKAQIDALDEVAKAEKKTRSEVIRDSVEVYLRNIKEGRYQARDNEVIRELKRIERGLRSLMVKSIRVSGQGFYWGALPYITGLPKARLFEPGKKEPQFELSWAKLNQEALNQHFDKSRAFAITLLRAKSSKEEREQEQDAANAAQIAEATAEDKEPAQDK